MSAPYNDGKIKHIAVAVYQARDASGDDKQTGEDYLCWAAQRQIAAGANFLDVNVDEYTNDAAERIETMRWLAGFLAQRFDTPLSIDSSNTDVIVAGLEACRKDAGPQMINSVSLERSDCIDVIKQFDTAAVVSAAGRDAMPSAPEERMANFTEIVGLLDAAGVQRDRMHLDPLVFPISTDPMHGKNFLETTRQAVAQFPGARLSGGFSNVSFGMPRRKLLNMVFTWLAVDAGASSGIIDPATMPPQAIAEMDTDAEPFRLARAFLTGEDMYGIEFIAAHRGSKLG